jgi:hypothetical protein
MLTHGNSAPKKQHRGREQIRQVGKVTEEICDAETHSDVDDELPAERHGGEERKHQPQYGQHEAAGGHVSPEACPWRRRRHHRSKSVGCVANR